MPLPEEWHIGEQPQLTPRAAFGVIWFLQERLHVIPDHYERCESCDDLFDTHSGGQIVSADDVDEYDQEMYDNLGVSSEELLQYAGMHFCDVSCEAEFWQRVHNGEIERRDLTSTEEER